MLTRARAPSGSKQCGEGLLCACAERGVDVESFEALTDESKPSRFDVRDAKRSDDVWRWYAVVGVNSDETTHAVEHPVNRVRWESLRELRKVLPDEGPREHPDSPAAKHRSH